MRFLGRRSIRTRITLGSLLVGAVVLTATALVLHVQIERATAETNRSLALGAAAPFVSDLRNNPDEAPDRPAPGVLVGIRSGSGRWVVDALPDAVRDRLPRMLGADTTLHVGVGDHAVTVVGVPVTNDAGTFVVWAAQDGRAGHETLERVDRSLVLGTVLALAAFGGTAWLLSTLALRPVGRMRRTAEAISAGSSDGHLPVGRSDDELAGLARTLNAFLDRQRADAERQRRMVSDASHELRTPLAALTARLELAHRSAGDAAALERELRAAEGDAARLAALADTLLELSRLDEVGAPAAVGLAAGAAGSPGAVAGAEGAVAGSPGAGVVGVGAGSTGAGAAGAVAGSPGAGAGAAGAVAGSPALGSAAADLVTELMGSIDRARALTDLGARDVDFSTDLDAPDARYRIDPAAFARVVDNLVANAIAAGSPGGVVRVALRQDGDRTLELRVVDDGTGVPEAFLPRAFDRFTRADPARRAALGGSGLGLALVRGTVLHAGGTVSLENGADGGAVATVRLPVA